jgi:Flp pilus assembly CpaF family ATPase
LAPEHERIVTIEDSPSTSLLNPQVLPLCRRALPSSSLQDLLQRAAALRPDRLLIDDLRLEEASTALLTAAGSGGALLGMHAPDPAVALSLLTHAAGLTVGGNPAALIAAALQLFVHVGPDSAGVRRVLSIQELQLGPAGVPELRKLFRHDAGGFVASFLGR